MGAVIKKTYASIESSPRFSTYIIASALIAILLMLLNPFLNLYLYSKVYTMIYVVWIVGLFVYSRLSWKSIAGLWVLALSFMLLSLMTILNIVWFAFDGFEVILSDPDFLNPDAANTWNNALMLLGHNVFYADPSQYNYGMFVAGEMMLFSGGKPDIAVPIVLNMLFTMLSIMLCGSISVKTLKRALPNQSTTWIGFVAMVLISSVCYFLQMGALMIKEAVSIMSFALAIRGILGVYHPEQREEYVRSFVTAVVGMFLLTFSRSNYLWFIALALLLTFPYTRKVSELKKHACVGGIILFLVVILSYWFASEFLTVSYLPRIVDPDTDSHFLRPEAHTRVWFDFVGDYSSMSFIAKLILLPFAAMLQFLIPFPWDFLRHVDYGISQIYAHFAYPWYLVGGLMIYFFFSKLATFKTFINDRRNYMLAALTAFGVAGWFIIAYITVGTVSRYTLSFLVVLIPGAVYTIATSLRTKPFTRYAAAYVLSMGLVLFVCHYLQHQPQINP